MRRFIWLVAPIYSAGVSLWLLVVPNLATAPSTGVLTPPGPRIDPTSMQVFTTLLVIDGWWVIVPLSVPIVLSAVPLLGHTFPTRRRLALVGSVLLVAFSFLAGLSIGTFYLPTVALLFAAALIPPRRADPLPSSPAV